MFNKITLTNYGMNRIIMNNFSNTNTYQTVSFILGLTILSTIINTKCEITKKPLYRDFNKDFTAVVSYTKFKIKNDFFLFPSKVVFHNKSELIFLLTHGRDAVYIRSVFVVKQQKYL